MATASSQYAAKPRSVKTSIAHHGNPSGSTFPHTLALGDGSACGWTEMELTGLRFGTSWNSATVWPPQKPWFAPSSRRQALRTAGMTEAMAASTTGRLDNRQGMLMLRRGRGESPVKSLLVIIGWCLLFVLCWPLAI